MSESLPPIELAGSIWFHTGSTNWGNPRRMALLAAIQEHGSIAAAARHINLSYKAAWDAVHTINSLTPEPLIICAAGGARGGGAHLSPKALEILALYQHMQHLHEQFLHHLAQLQPGHQDTLELLHKMLLHTSARNTFTGTIQAIEEDAIHALISLDIGLSEPIHAAITQESRQQLQLERGQEALAFIKATAIELSPHQPSVHPMKSSFLAHLQDTQSSPRYTQARLALTEVLTLTAILPKEESQNWPRPWPQHLWVSINAQHVLIGRSGLQ